MTDRAQLPRELKLVVLDANAFWTEQLFTACTCFADVLLLKPLDFRAHHVRNGRWRGDSQARKIGERLWEQRFSMPPGWMFSLWRCSARRFARHIGKFVDDAPFVFLITYPQYRSLLALLQSTLSIYYNLDDYSDNWPEHARALEQWENETVAAADLTVCIARYRMGQLQTRVADKAGSIHHLPLGTTPEFMSTTPGQAVSLPERLRDIPKPRVGHVGALNWRFDYNFLSEAARLLPEMQFVLGGKIPSDSDGDTKWLEGLRLARTLPNIHFIGWIEHDALGEYLRAFDVLLICYSDCRFNRNASPAKLWDYFGSSRPIVANDRNPETQLWREVIRIGETPEDFAGKITEALAEEGNEAPARRLKIAQAHTWDQLSHRVEQIIASAIGKEG